MGNQDLAYNVVVNSETLLIAILILVGFLVLATLISMMRIYKKAGKPQISAIVPIWSQIVMFQIVEKPAWYVFLLFVPIVGIIINIQAYVLLAKKFGKGTIFAIGMIFLPMIFIPLLSFYDYEDKNVQVDEPIYNPFNEESVAVVMPSAPIEDNKNSEVVESINFPEISGQEEENMSNDGVNISESTVDNKSIENFNIPSIDPVENDDNATIVEKNEGIINDGMEIPVLDSVSNETVEISKDSTADEPLQNIQNPTIQDLENILSKKEIEPKDLAFGSIPQSVEHISNNEELTESINVDNIDSEEIIEMPEKAAKTCPACGVSLDDNIKYCTSCGTQL